MNFKDKKYHIEKAKEIACAAILGIGAIAFAIILFAIHNAML